MGSRVSLKAKETLTLFVQCVLLVILSLGCIIHIPIYEGRSLSLVDNLSSQVLRHRRASQVKVTDFDLCVSIKLVDCCVNFPKYESEC